MEAELSTSLDDMDPAVAARFGWSPSRSYAARALAHSPDAAEATWPTPSPAGAAEEICSMSGPVSPVVSPPSELSSPYDALAQRRGAVAAAPPAADRRPVAVVAARSERSSGLEVPRLGVASTELMRRRRSMSMGMTDGHDSASGDTDSSSPTATQGSGRQRYRHHMQPYQEAIELLEDLVQLVVSALLRA